MEEHSYQQCHIFDAFQLLDSRPQTFEIELQKLLNKHGIDNRLGIADYELTEILVKYMAIIADVKRREWKENI